MDPVVVDPVLAAHGAPLLGGHVPGDDEVTEGPVVVLEVLNIGYLLTVELCGLLPRTPGCEHWRGPSGGDLNNNV